MKIKVRKRIKREIKSKSRTDWGSIGS